MSSTHDTAADPIGHEPTTSDYLLSENFTSPTTPAPAVEPNPPHAGSLTAPPNPPTAAAPTAALNGPAINNPPAVNNPPAAANSVPVVAKYPHTVANPVNQGHVSWRDGRQFATVRGKEARVLAALGEITTKIAKDARKHTQNPPPGIPADEQRDLTTFYNRMFTFSAQPASPSWLGS